MIVKGYIHSGILGKFINCRWQRLDVTMLGKKKLPVYREVIYYKKGRGSVSMLFLSPGSVVKKHTHVDDLEIYMYWNTKSKHFMYEVCGCGHSHGIKNVSKKRWAIVLAIKFDYSQ